MAKETDDPRFVAGPDESPVRERIQRAEQGQQLRPGALCPNCGGHAFRRAELKAGAACPKCGKAPRLAA
jgi:predicted Zn-ribbon and HTH transcriptional regulator